MSIKFLDVRWYTGSSCVGIVRALDEYTGVKYYIGNGSSSTEESDIDHIMKWGAKFPNDAGDLLFGVSA